MPAPKLGRPVRVVVEQEVLYRMPLAAATTAQMRLDPAVDPLLMCGSAGGPLGLGQHGGLHDPNPKRDVGVAQTHHEPAEGPPRWLTHWSLVPPLDPAANRRASLDNSASSSASSPIASIASTERSVSRFLCCFCRRLSRRFSSSSVTLVRPIVPAPGISAMAPDTRPSGRYPTAASTAPMIASTSVNAPAISRERMTNRSYLSYRSTFTWSSLSSARSSSRIPFRYRSCASRTAALEARSVCSSTTGTSAEPGLPRPSVTPASSRPTSSMLVASEETVPRRRLSHRSIVPPF